MPLQDCPLKRLIGEAIGAGVRLADGIAQGRDAAKSLEFAPELDRVPARVGAGIEHGKTLSLSTAGLREKPPTGDTVVRARRECRRRGKNQESKRQSSAKKP